MVNVLGWLMVGVWAWVVLQVSVGVASFNVFG